MTPTALILAAGKSSRTWPIEEKIFVKFLGKTVFEHQVKTLQEAGIADFCVIGNNQNIEKLKTLCADFSGNFSFGIQENLNEGQRGGILASEKILPKEKPLLVVCSNDVVEKNAFENIVSTAEKSNSEIFLLAKKVEKYFPGGYLSVESGNKVKKIVEKPGEGNEPSNLVTLLIHYYKNPKKLFEKLKKVESGDMYEECLQELFTEGITAEAVEYIGFWQAIKYPWHLLTLTDYFLSTLTKTLISKDAFVSENACIKGNVVIEAGVKVFDFAVINGPAYIGKDTIIANHSLVRESIIEEKCVVGHTTEIARSLLQSHCWTHQNFVGDSVFDENVSLGAGTRTGNLRLDEKEIYSIIKGEKIGSQRNKLGSTIGKNVRIGINTSIMPGVKIGKDTFVGGGMITERDVCEKKFTYQKTFTEEKNNMFTAEKRKDF
jgi:NDP-sugar pyrophosphorylase family protein